jgi:hypothetical protein
MQSSLKLKLHLHGKPRPFLDVAMATLPLPGLFARLQDARQAAPTVSVKQFFDNHAATITGADGQTFSGLSFECTLRVQSWDLAYYSPGEEDAEVVTEKDMDTYSATLVKLIKLSMTAGKSDAKRDAKLIPLPFKPKGNYPTEILLDGYVEVLLDDEHFKFDPKEKFVMSMINRLPFVDEPRYFNSAVSAKASMARFFSGVFLPTTPEGAWDNDTSDESFARYVFFNNGSVFVRPCDGGFVCDLSQISSTPVREKYLPYGGKAFFSADFAPLRIEVDGETFYPPNVSFAGVSVASAPRTDELLRMSNFVADEVVSAGQQVIDESSVTSLKRLHNQWAFAKLRIRSTLFPMMSAVHLMQGHFIWGGYPNLALRTHLSPTHCLRRLLSAHYFRTTHTINKSLVTLLPEGALLHRSTAFEHAGLMRVFKDALGSFTFKSWPDELKASGMLDCKYFPLATDGMDFYRVVQQYVCEYVDLYYPTGDVNSDQEASAFYGELQRRLRGLHEDPDTKVLSPHPISGLPNFDVASLKMVCTELIFRVSAYHEHVGNVNAAGLSPTMICPLLQKDEEGFGRLTNSVSSAVIIGAITALTTAQTYRSIGNTDYPNIDGDWKHHMLDFPNGPACQIWDRFHARLLDLERIIEARNADNTRCWPINDFNPKFVNLSIAS